MASARHSRRRSRPLDLQDERINVTRLQRRVEETPVEIAVVADGGAEGDVDVQTEHY
jgi:hypothetical protein